MSKLFRFSESLEKSNGKKWSQISKLLLIKGEKSPRKKKVSFLVNFALLAGFFWYRCYYPHRLRDSVSPVCGIFIKVLLGQVSFTSNGSVVHTVQCSRGGVQCSDLSCQIFLRSPENALTTNLVSARNLLCSVDTVHRLQHF